MGPVEWYRVNRRLRSERRRFLHVHGYPLDLLQPRSYNEKIVWRKYFDRNPLFPTFCDKYASRDYVVERLGRDEGEPLLVPLLFVGTDPGAIPFDELPAEYIIKPSHGSGWSVIVDAGRPLCRERTVHLCRKWLRRTYGQDHGEWGYGLVTPRIMVERFLRSADGRPAADYKFYVFHGRVHMVYVLYDRFGAPSEAFYDRDFRRLHVNSAHGAAPDVPEPPEFGRMAELAERLAGDLDFLRVDLYLVDGRIWFGEFTLYPGSGYYRYEPPEFERRLGEVWTPSRAHARPLWPWPWGLR